MQKMNDIVRPSDESNHENHSGPREGALYQSLGPVEERDRKRNENPFLQKLKNKKEDVTEHMSEGEEEEERIEKPRRTRRWLYLIGLVIVLFFLYYAFFPKVSVTISPRQQTVTLASVPFHATLSATTSVSASSTATSTESTSSSSESALPFRLVTVTETASTTATATGQKTVDNQASGQIIVYNNYSAEQMPLIAHTRFEAPNGLIYRVKDAFIVPGMQGNTPGQVTVTVYADDSGSEYNLSDLGTKFTIPGLEDSPDLYQGFYAKLKTPITGGYKGTQKIVSDEDLQNVQDSLSKDLSQKLFAKAESQIGDNSILFQNAATTTYTESVAAQDSLGQDQARVVVTGTLEGIVFDKAALATAVASRSASNYSGGSVTSPDWSALQFAFATESPDWSNLNDFPFTLTGVLPLVWKVDTDAVAMSLSGAKKSDFESILNQYHSIDHAKTVMRPFWKSSFPEDPQAINITVEQAGTSSAK